MYTPASETLEVAQAIHSFLEWWALGVFIGVVACDLALHFIGDTGGLTWNVQWAGRSTIIHIMRRSFRVGFREYRGRVSLRALLKTVSLIGFGVAITMEFVALPYSERVDQLTQVEAQDARKSIVAALIRAAEASKEGQIAHRAANDAKERASTADKEATRAREHAASLEVEAQRLRLANLTLESQLSPRLFQGQDAAAHRLSAFLPTTVRLQYLTDPEAKRTAEQINFVLFRARWNVRPEPFPASADLANTEAEFVDGVAVTPGVGFKEDEGMVSRRTQLLIDELNRTNITAVPGDFQRMGSITVVRVGLKPSPALSRFRNEHPELESESGRRLALPSR
jgi:hypothetical protein